MTHVIRVPNVCRALPAGVDHLLSTNLREDTRAGPALVSPGPVVTVTTSPRERVLFSAVRDANPFLHLYEAIWMLAGRDDAAPLNQFVRDFGSKYGEPGGEVHGAYGRRWRSAFGFDQLDHVVGTLRRDPGSRQCVLQMWDCAPIEWSKPGHDDLRGAWRDRPCNTHVYARVRESREVRGGDICAERVLDLTVLCRSNDAIWGAHGANAVHFSILQEYLAARIGVGVGIMYQFSHNYHAYLSEIERLTKRAESRTSPSYESTKMLRIGLMDDRYYGLGLIPSPLFERPEAIDEDVRRFMLWHDAGEAFAPPTDYANSWFSATLTRVMRAHMLHRAGNAPGALHYAHMIESPDWRIACVEWLERRKK